MTNHDEYAKVINIIPYQSLRKRHCLILGDVCQDYVLEGELKKLFSLRERKIISAGELGEMCGAAVGQRVNGGVSARYVRELEGLIEQHNKTQGQRLTAISEEGEDVVCLGALYGRPFPKELLNSLN